MAIKLPTYERQVKIQDTQQKVIDNRINIPAPSNAIERQISNIGDNLSNISNIILKKREKDEQVKQLDLQNKILNDYTDLLWSNEDIDIKDEQGNIIQTKKGLLLRTGKNAKGISDEYFKIQQQMIDKYIDGKSEKEIQGILPIIGKISLSNKDNIYKHEANQENIYNSEVFNANIENLKTVALNLPTNQNIDTSIQSIKNNIDTFYKDKDKVVKDSIYQKQTDDLLGKIIDSSLDSDNYIQGESILNTYKDKISKDMYNIALNKVEKVKQEQLENKYNIDLLKATGDDFGKAMKIVNNDKNLSEDGKQKQLSSFETYFNRQQKANNLNKSDIEDDIIKFALTTKQTAGINGLNTALKYAENKLNKYIGSYSGSQFDEQSKIGVKRYIENLFDVEKIKEKKEYDYESANYKINIMLDTQNRIERGDFLNKNQLSIYLQGLNGRDGKQLFNYSDIKGLIGSFDKSNIYTPINKDITAKAKDLYKNISQSDISDILEDLNGLRDIYYTKNKTHMPKEEYQVLADEYLKKKIIDKNVWGTGKKVTILEEKDVMDLVNKMNTNKENVKRYRPIKDYYENRLNNDENSRYNS